MLIVAAILIAALAANITANLKFPALLDVVPVLGIAVWVVILLDRGVAQAGLVGDAGTRSRAPIFLLALVTAASMMPVEKLPAASWPTTLGLGFVSAVFDNIPLTALALKQGGYDWGYLAYAVGFGGSMIWFGSSAGVALSNMYPEAKSVGRWITPGLADRGRLRRRIFRHARHPRLASRRAAASQLAHAARRRAYAGGAYVATGRRISDLHHIVFVRLSPIRKYVVPILLKPCLR